jgi:hypothetical protein
MSQLRLLFRLVIVLVICFIAVALPSAPTQAICRFPKIELSVDRGVPGDTVTVSGLDFDRDEYVDIYYDGTWLDHTLPNSYTGNFKVTITIPESPAGRYKIRAESASDREEATFKTTPGVVVSPIEGLAGTTVTAQGRGFAEYETGIEVRYYLNGIYEMVAENIEADARGSWETSFQIPTVPQGKYSISAYGEKTALIKAVRLAVFEVGPVISVCELSGSIGQSISVNGSGFAADEKDIRILLDGKAVPTVPPDIQADDTGCWEASFEVPGIPTGEYSITAEGRRTRKADVGDVSFQIKPAIALSPDQGHVGTNMTVAGQGFPPGKGVAIHYNGSQVTTTTTGAGGSFEVSFPVPESRHNEQLVTAVVTEGPNGTAVLGSNATAIFVMESNHPETPDLISPTDRQKVGLVFKVRPTFEWSEVSDDSGVYYSLQIATSADFEPASVVVSVTGLTETSYTLNNVEALPNGTYYWAVQAVDGAENESGWAEVGSFLAGRLPLWGFIIIMVVAAVLLIILIRALLIRRSIYCDRW